MKQLYYITLEEKLLSDKKEYKIQHEFWKGIATTCNKKDKSILVIQPLTVNYPYLEKKKQLFKK